MIDVYLNSTDLVPYYRVKFVHNNPKPEDVDEKFDENGRFLTSNRWTGCIIYDNADCVVAKMRRYVHPNDNYSKAMGRKLSLERALNQLQADKRTRTRFWSAVFEACPNQLKSS